MIAAEILAGRQGARLFHGGAGREIEEVESVRTRGGKYTSAEFGVDKFLNRGIGDRFTRVVRGESGGAYALAVTNGFARDAVFSKLVDEGARKDEIEERVDLAGKNVVRRFLPGLAPENSEDIDARQERAIAVGEMRGGCGCIAGEGVHGNDAEGMLVLGFGSGGAVVFFGRHEWT